MQISLRTYGGGLGFPHKIIELRVSTNNTTIVEDVINLKGEVDVNLIEQLESVLYDLKEQNELVKSKSL